MVNGQPALVLPLMHHLVQQRLGGLAPTMSSDVAATYGNLGALTRWIAVSVMSKSTLHASRHAYRYPGKRAVEPLTIEHLISAHELLSHRFIVGMSSFSGGLLSPRRLELQRELRLIVWADHPASSTTEAEEKL